MVKVTTFVGRGVPAVGLSVLSVALSVVGEPFTAVVGPVKVTVLESGFTVKVLEVVSDPSGVELDVSPEKEAVKVYELEGSDAVMSQVAVPVASVSAVHVSEPLSVKVTGSLTIAVWVLESVSTAETGVGEEKLPETG
jgi:hypothetical protein